MEVSPMYTFLVSELNKIYTWLEVLSGVAEGLYLKFRCFQILTIHLFVSQKESLDLVEKASDSSFFQRLLSVVAKDALRVELINIVKKEAMELKKGFEK